MCIIFIWPQQLLGLFAVIAVVFPTKNVPIPYMIKNLIIDLCGPIIRVDTTRIDDRLHRLGATVAAPYLTLYREGRVKEFDAGLISFDDFCADASQRLGIRLTPATMEGPWNALVADCDLRNLQTIADLHGRYRLFLLSNSDCVNAAYFASYLNRRARQSNIPSSGADFLSLFDEVLFSYSVQLRKPDPAIFRLLMERHQLRPDETLFIDDCLKHCQSAATLGLHTLHCTTPLYLAPINS